MAWLSNGIALREAAQVFGASRSSKRAWNAKSPARTISWLIRDTRDCEGEFWRNRFAAEAAGSKEHWHCAASRMLDPVSRGRAGRPERRLPALTFLNGSPVPVW